MRILNRLVGNQAHPLPGDLVICERHGEIHVGLAEIEVRTIATFTKIQDAVLFAEAKRPTPTEHYDHA